MADTVKFLKIRDVKSPDRANQYDAGIDFYVPRFKAPFIKDLKEKNPDIFETKYCCDSHILANTSVCSTLTITGSSGSSTSYKLDDDNNSIIKFDDEKGLNYFLLAPHQRVLIPSGIKSRMANPGRALIAANKSGVATKNGLVFGAQVVDYLYQGEIHLSLLNVSSSVVRIYENMKILQFLETPVFNSDIAIENGYDSCCCKKDVIDTKSFYDGMSTERGEKGFGSSNEEKNLDKFISNVGEKITKTKK